MRLGREPPTGEHHGHGTTRVSLGAIRRCAVDECQWARSQLRPLGGVQR